MGKNRFEAFSDGVIAIIITIMVLELHVPHGHDFSVLVPMIPKFISYIISFVYIGIYWNNHHHMLHAVNKVNGTILWANLHLLFWLSLVPFITGWAGENYTASVPVAVYGFVMLMAGIAFSLLSRALIHHHGKDSTLAEAIGSDLKGNISIAAYFSAIIAAFFSTWISIALYIIVAAMWFIPDSRIEKRLEK